MFFTSVTIFLTSRLPIWLSFIISILLLKSVHACCPILYYIPFTVILTVSFLDPSHHLVQGYWLLCLVTPDYFCFLFPAKLALHNWHDLRLTDSLGNFSLTANDLRPPSSFPAPSQSWSIRPLSLHRGEHWPRLTNTSPCTSRVFRKALQASELRDCLGR